MPKAVLNPKPRAEVEAPPKKREPGHYIAKGKALMTLRGSLGPGTLILPGDFVRFDRNGKDAAKVDKAADDERRADLTEKGYLEVVE